jgi:Zn-dependent protease with chaperone function
MKNIFKSIGFKLLFIVAIFSVFASFRVHAAKINEPDDNLYHLVKIRTELQGPVNELLSTSKLYVKVTEMRVRALEAITFSKSLVGVSQGVIELSLNVRGDVGLAVAAVAHELGHAKSGQVVQGEGVKSRNQERAADYYGAKLLHDSRQGCDLQVQLYQELYEANIGLRSGVHPATQERIKSAKRNCDSLQRTGKLPSNLYFE